MRRRIRKYKWFILGICVMLLAVCAMLKAYADTPGEYCKNIISYGNGYAAIFESHWTTCVVTFDDKGAVGQKAVALHANPVLAREYNCRTIFEENGELYVLGCAYSSDRDSVRWRIEKCNFTWGTFSTEWELEEREGYAFSAGNLPRIIDGDLYVTYTEDKTGDAVTFRVTPENQYEIVSRTKLPDNALLEKTVYTSGGTVAVTTCYGMFLGDERIYPLQEDGNCMLSGIGYDGDTVSTVDIHTDQLISYVGREDRVEVTDLQMGDYSRFQSMRIHPDRGITCSYESGDKLYGCYAREGETQVFDRLETGIFWGPALKESMKIELLYILTAVLLKVINKLARRKNGVEKQKGFIGLSMRATIASLGVMLLFMVFSAPEVYNKILLINSEWKQKYVDTEAENFAAYIAVNVRMEVEDGAPRMKEEDYEAFARVMKRYTAMVRDSGGDACDVCVFALHDDKIYCIYSAEFSGAIPAEYAVSRNVVDACRDTLSGSEKTKYEDKRSIGRLTYYSHPFSIYPEDGEAMRLSMSVVTDGYRDRVEYYHLVPRILVITIVMDLLFVVILNLFVRKMLRRLRQLSWNLREYGETKEPECIVLDGKDEIAQTAQAIRTMAQGLDIYTKDLNESNANFRKLLPTGILKMMGHDRISQVELNEAVQRQVSVIYLTFYGTDRKPLMGKIIEHAEKNGDKIAEFNYEKICIVIGERENRQDVQRQYQELFGNCADIDFAEEERIFASVGNEENAYLISMKKMEQPPVEGDFTDGELDGI